MLKFFNLISGKTGDVGKRPRPNHPCTHQPSWWAMCSHRMKIYTNLVWTKYISASKRTFECGVFKKIQKFTLKVLLQSKYKASSNPVPCFSSSPPPPWRTKPNRVWEADWIKPTRSVTRQHYRLSICCCFGWLWQILRRAGLSKCNQPDFKQLHWFCLHLLWYLHLHTAYTPTFYSPSKYIRSIS